MTASSSSHHESRIGRALTVLVDNPKRVVVGVVLFTAVLIAAGIATASHKDASFDPGGEVYATAELVERTFRPSTTELEFIVEDENADALDLATLREWKRNSEKLRASAELRPALSRYFDSDLGRTVTGFYTIADAVDDELRSSGVADGLEGATETDVKIALSRVLDKDRPTALYRDVLSVHATSEQGSVGGGQITVWKSPAFLTRIRVDHSAFPVDLETKSDPESRTQAQQDAIDSARDLEIEHWGRDALKTLRGEREHFGAWGVAIDNTLTSDEAFNATIPFLFAAFAAILLLVGGLLRSYWAVALAGVGIAVTVLWARMLAKIFGFDDSIILDVIVPIATVSFGIDFLIHAVGRVREELSRGTGHRAAYVVGIASVVGALALALSTSAIALASNATSHIQAVTEFGFGAAIALGSAFVVLGILAPLFLLRIEEAVASAPPRPESRFRRVTSRLRLIATALVAGGLVVAILAVPFVGIIGTVVFALVALALPVWRVRRKAAKAPARAAAVAPNTAGESSVLAGRLVAGLVRRRYALLIAVALVTVVAGFGATHVGRQTKPTDFYPSSSDFIVGLDKVIEHTSTASPGDVYVYLAGEIDDPRLLAAVERANETVAGEGGDLFARNPDGTPTTPDSALDIARAGISIDYVRTSVADSSGQTLTDTNRDGLPDDAAQVRALFTYATENGVPSDASTFVYTKDQVARLLQPLDGGGFATVIRYPLQGFPDTSKVKQARRTVESSTSDLTEKATGNGLSIDARVSGDVVAEQVSLDAVTDAMVISIPLAIVLCFAVAAFAMRSVRLAAVSVVPIALVIAWLLAFMAAFDYNINIVTATIAAISVGVGIDFSIHYTMRYREQLRIAATRLDAVRGAAESTGAALILSGMTSIIGFGLLALAPMPIFAAYGLLTAVMIALSLVASLVVLPSLLYLLAGVPASHIVPELAPSQQSP